MMHLNTVVATMMYTAATAVAAAPASLPMLFMTAADVRSPRGLQYPVATPAVDMTATLCAPAAPLCNVTTLAMRNLVQGGLMAPNPLRPEAGYELFYVDDVGVDDVGGGVEGLFYLTTVDFLAFTAPVQVATLRVPNAAAIRACIVKSMARSDDGARYLAMAICGSDVGFRPMAAAFPLRADRPFTPLNATPAFWDHDDANVAYDASSGRFVDLQITFESQRHPKEYCDNVGLARCAEGYRRVVTLRAAADAAGLAWSDDAACPGERWDPEHTKRFDPQFRTCARGWNASGMVVPDADDPPELEFYKLAPMRVGATRRVVGHALLYAPAPDASLGSHAYPPGIPCGNLTRGCHGPHVGVARWVGPSDGALTRLPLAAAWARPFRRQGYAGRRHRLAPNVGELFTVGGPLFRDHHVWVSRTAVPGPPARDAALLGVPAYRLAGMFAPANAQFSTPAFAVPNATGAAAAPRLWLNADASWERPPAGARHGCDIGCGAYVMVEARDAASGRVIAGFEKERCVFLDADGVRLALAWNGTSTAALRGRSVALRVYFRDAVVYAVGLEEE